MNISLLNLYLNKGKKASIFVVGNSMGDLFLKKTKVKIIKKKRYLLGDIVVFNKNKRLNAHRVIKKIPGFIITKGDTLPLSDEPISYHRIFGKVVEIEDLFVDSLIYKLKNIFIAIFSRWEHNINIWKSK